MIRERAGHSLQITALVNEAYIRLVELRFFGGLTEEETAEVLRVSPETVKRDWRLAKVWLLCELTDGKAKDEAGKVARDRADP